MQLERAELQDREVLGANFRQAVKKRCADVAAEMHLVSRRLEQLCRDGRGRGLAVAARDCDNAAGTQRAKRLHLTRKHSAALRRLSELRHGGQHARRTENDVKVQMLQIILAGPKLSSAREQFLPCFAHCLGSALVADRNITASVQQDAHERTVAHAIADDADLFSL